MLHGDAGSKRSLLCETCGTERDPARDPSMESSYECGSRIRGWQSLPEFVQPCLELGHEIASHRWRWIDVQNVSEAIDP